MITLKPTNDYLFKRIFGREKNYALLKDLLESILPHLKIKSLTINQEVSLERELMSDKLGILDIVATLEDNTIINIEMQVKNHKNTIDRSIFYESGLIHENLKQSENYSKLPKTIGIWILNFEIFNSGPFHEIARLKRDYENIVLTDKFELHYIQLPKFRKKCKRISTKLEEWLTFISHENLEEIKMIENEYIQKAEEELEYLTGDEAERRLAFLREKAIRDEVDAISTAKEEGIEQGQKQEKFLIAKKMLTKNIDIKTIIEITGLTKSEIENL